MRIGLATALIVCGASVAWADRLPKNASPMSADEITKLYAGQTQVSKVSDIFFDPSGTTKGIFGKPKATGTFSGKWTVMGNEFCMTNSPKGESKTYKDCNKFWKVGEKIWNLWSTHYDGTKADDVKGYDPGIPPLKPGDLVSKRYAAMGGT